MNNSRAILVIVFVIAFFGVLLYRLFTVQILDSNNLKYYAKRQQTTVEKIRAERGLIYDRNNVLLVYNRNDVSYYVDLRMLSKKNKKKITDKFSQVFGKPKSYFREQMSDSGKTICIERKASTQQALQLKDFKITGLFSKEDPTRVYYYQDLASHLLGYVGTDYHGMDGIAKSCDKILSGEDGSMVVIRDAIGDMVSVEEQETKPAVPGDNIYLTIDKSYQNILELQLTDGLKKYEGTSAVGIIMNPNNGEILALADAPGFDPNEYWKYTDTTRRDRAVTDTYEPGSTFKSFSFAALLNQNLLNLDEKVFVDNGRYKLKNVYITDAHKAGWLTAREVILETISPSCLVTLLIICGWYKIPPFTKAQ